MRCSVPLLIAGLLAATPAALSAQSSLPDGIVAARVLPGWRTAAGTHMAGLEILLAPGWKTYWRAPGDAGIPPEFLWSDASNVAGMSLHWPVPEVSHQNGLRTIGYSDRIVIPMEFATPEAGAAARISGEVEIGVCAEICVPVRLPISAELPPGGGRSPEIVSALLDAPEAAEEAGVAGVDCRLAPISDGLRIDVAIDMPALGPAEEVVIETADPEVWVSEPVAARSGGRLTATADLVHISAGAFALDRSGLRITVLGDGRAVDIRGCD